MRFKRLPEILLTASLLGVYLATLAPSLTWANHGADGGDLITAAATNGVAHPSGYPTYLLLARLFQLIPIGTLAFRTNLMSALAAGCAALIVYKIVNASHKVTASLAAAYAIGLAPLFWSQAVITEVYTLHILFIALLLYISQDDSRGFLFGSIFGLSLGNHITTILLLPLLFHKQKKILLHRLAGLAIGALIYITLPMRAMFHPPINWGSPVTIKNFIWLISGDLYQGQIFAPTAAELWVRLQSIALLFFDQFGVVGLLVGFTGAIAYYKPLRLNHSMIWIALVFSIFPIIYDTPDSYLYLLPAFLCFAIWIGVGLGGVMEMAGKKSARLSLWVGLVFLAVLFIRAGGNWSRIDASRDMRAENFGKAAMSAIPPNAIVFAKGDQAVLALWYFHYALHQRSDAAIVAADLLQNEWYQETLRHNYPNLDLPAEFFMFPEVIIARNPGRAICYIGQDLNLACK